MALADVKAYFRLGRIHPDLTGAFGFYTDNYYFIATAMVFGSNTLATSWEPFLREIKALSQHYANRPDLISKHCHYLDMVQWAPSNLETQPIWAFPCSRNPGILDSSALPWPQSGVNIEG